MEEKKQPRKKTSRKRPPKRKAPQPNPAKDRSGPQVLNFPAMPKCDQCGQASWKTYDSALIKHPAFTERRRHMVCANCNRHGVSSQRLEN